MGERQGYGLPRVGRDEVRIPQTIGRVTVFAAPPWQGMGTLVDYELQYGRAGSDTLDKVKEPTKTFKVYTPPVRCTVDSFFSDRWIFMHEFKPVTAQKIRLLINRVTNGGGATPLVQRSRRAGGRPADHPPGDRGVWG